jgi:hypothetical protein
MNREALAKVKWKSSQLNILNPERSYNQLSPAKSELGSLFYVEEWLLKGRNVAHKQRERNNDYETDLGT